MTDAAPVLLHVFSTFGRGGAQVRTAAIVNALGDRYRHVIVSMDGRFETAALLDEQLDVELLSDWPAPGTRPGRVDLYRLLRDEEPDLLLTYNWGAIEAVAAGRLLGLPVIHAEDGFNPDEADGQKMRRVLARRALLRSAAALVVPSQLLQRIALRTWAVHPPVLRYIPNAIDCTRFRPGEAAALRAELGVAPDELLVGTVGHLGGSKNVGLMIRAVATQPDRERFRILVVGDGPQRPGLQALADGLGIGDRIRFAGDVDDPAGHLRAMDIFTLTSRTEQMPLVVLEAMATALPVVATDVGDVAAMVSPENAGWIVSNDAVGPIAEGIAELARDGALRRSIGRANLRTCRARFDERLMFERYDALWTEILEARSGAAQRRA